MLRINAAELIELMKQACKHVRDRCCGPFALIFLIKKQEQEKNKNSSDKG